MDSIIIREANPGDADEIMSIYVDSYREICPNKSFSEIAQHDRKAYGESYPFLSSQNLRNWIEKHGEKDFLLVVQIREEIAGFIKFSASTPWEEVGYIEEIHIKRSIRGRGIGTVLLKKAEETLRQQGAKAVYVEAWKGAVGFFVKNSYIPLGWEPKPYMGTVEYLDLIKSLAHPRLLHEAMQHIQQGNYRDTANLLQKTLKTVKKLKIKNTEYYDLLRLYAEYIAEDLETQTYYPLAQQIISAAKTLPHPFSDVLCSLALEIEGDAEEYLLNYKTAAEKFGQAARMLQSALKKLEKDPALATPPLKTFTTLLKCKVTYYKAHSLLIKQYIEPVDEKTLKAAISELEEEAQQCRKIPDICSYINYTISKLKTAKYVPKKKVDLTGKLIITDYFYLGGPADTEQNEQTLKEKLKNAGAPEHLKITKNYDYIPEDMLNPQLYENIKQNILIEYPHMQVTLRSADKQYALNIAAKAIIFTNGYGILELTTSFNNMDPLALTLLAKIYDEAMPEIEITTENQTIKTKLAEHVHATVLQPIIKALGKQQAIMPDNSTPHTIVIVNDVKPDAEIQQLLNNYPELHALINPQTTLFSEAEPIQPQATTQTTPQTVQQNIAPSIGLHRSHISTNEKYTLFLTPYERSWYIEELASLAKLTALAKFVLHAISAQIDEHFQYLAQEELNYTEAINFINEVKNHYINNTWLYQSLTSTPYPEYQNLIDALKAGQGLERKAEILAQKIETLDKTLDIQLNKLNLDLAKTSSQQQTAIDILTALISSLTIGDIIYSIIQAQTPAQQATKMLAYLIPFVATIAIIRLLYRRKQ